MARRGPDSRAPRSNLPLYAWCAAAIAVASAATVYFTNRGAAYDTRDERASAPVLQPVPSYLSVSTAAAPPRFTPPARVARN